LDVEIFETRREFNKRFPSKTFLCKSCGHMTPNEFFCPFCGAQANGLFKKGTYQYVIKEESDQINEIFTPIELQEGATDDN